MGGEGEEGKLLHQLQMLNSPALEMYHEKDGKSELPPPARDHGALLSSVSPRAAAEGDDHLFVTQVAMSKNSLIWEVKKKHGKITFSLSFCEFHFSATKLSPTKMGSHRYVTTPQGAVNQHIVTLFSSLPCWCQLLLGGPLSQC